MPDLDLCSGQTYDDRLPCTRRAECLRYVEALHNPSPEPYAWYVHPQIPWPCAYFRPLPTPTPETR